MSPLIPRALTRIGPKSREDSEPLSRTSRTVPGSTGVTVPSLPRLSSLRRISKYNEKMKFSARSHLVHAVRKVLLYEMNDIRPRLLLLPVSGDWDPACGAPPYAEDFDTSDWFDGDKQVITEVYSIPGTSCYLSNGYDIVSVRRSIPERCPSGQSQSPNRTLDRLFGIDWPGNLMVMKRGSRGYGRVVHITTPEVSTINAIVQRWLQIQLRQRASTLHSADLSSEEYTD